MVPVTPKCILVASGATTKLGTAAPKRVTGPGVGHQNTTTGPAVGMSILCAHNFSDLAPRYMPIARPRLVALTSPPSKSSEGRGGAMPVPVGGREATFPAFCRHSRGLSATSRPKDARLRPFRLAPACRQ